MKTKKPRGCALCLAMKNGDCKILVDLETLPFEVLEYNGCLMVVLREHAVRPKVRTILSAVKTLRDVALERYGSLFWMNVRDGPIKGHWTASAMPLRNYSANEIPEDSGTVRCTLCGSLFVLAKKHLKLEDSGVCIRCPKGCRLELSVDDVLHAA